jgi:hypothetical protein
VQIEERHDRLMHLMQLLDGFPDERVVDRGRITSAPPITIESLNRSQPRQFTLFFSACRFHGASTNQISCQFRDSKKPLKTMRSQGLKTWLRG